jgi:hypothetical protein
MERFFSHANVALYRLLVASTDADERRAILKLLADETTKLKSELRQAGSGGRGELDETRH